MKFVNYPNNFGFDTGRLGIDFDNNVDNKGSDCYNNIA